MSTKQRECLIRGRKEIKISSTTKITVTRCGEWGKTHKIVVEEIHTTTTTVKVTEKRRIEYNDSQKCIKDFDKIVRDIQREYKNVIHF